MFSYIQLFLGEFYSNNDMKNMWIRLNLIAKGNSYNKTL